ncbi:restriction endonuclease [Mucilaginibacter defluvii]|uniref:Restriction endonuclease n=1 Tax=Mucilaginibacter defluvii TaxID=1196019 RepID=A0ABP9FMP8_9SPHI
MDTYSFYLKFESIVEKLLRDFNFHIQKQQQQVIDSKRYHIDLLINRYNLTILVELKFYRSKKGVAGAVRDAGQQLVSLLNAYNSPASGLLIIAAYATPELRDELRATGIILWDRSDLYNLIRFGLGSSQLLEEFEQLLNEAKQGLDTEDVFADVVISKESPDTYFELLAKHFVRSAVPPSTAPKKDYCAELNAIPEGKAGWNNYERKCIEILHYLFEDDLNNWHTQSSTDDGLSRFDMICRIVSADDFWKSLIQSFNSRYVLFEFKNYADPIGQDQIYTTERYLYVRGLRAVGFIIARNGGSERAKSAAKGALREHGKLMLILDNHDLCEMVKLKASGGLPNDYLSVKLDDFLITLSR